MALDKQNVPISLAQGLDTRTDPKQLNIGKLTEIKNATFGTPKQYTKRNGFTQLTNSIQGGGTIGAGVAATAYNNELVISDGSNIYSYNSSAPNWVNKGAIKNVSISSTAINLTSDGGDVSQDSAINGNLQVFVWSALNGNVCYSVIDNTTGQKIVANAVLFTPGATIPIKVMATGNYFIFVYNDYAGNLIYYAINVATPTSITGPVTFKTDAAASDYQFDCAIVNSKVAVFYHGTGSVMNICTIDATLSVSATYSFGSAIPTVFALTVCTDASYNFWCAYSSGSLTYVAVVNNAMNALSLSFTSLGVGSNASSLTMLVSGTTATVYMNKTTVLYPATLSPSQGAIVKNTITFAGSVGSITNLMLGVYLASKMFSYNGTFYVFVLYPTELQGTYFLIDQNSNVIAKFMQAQSGQAQTYSILPEAYNTSGSIYQSALLKRTSITPNENSLLIVCGVEALSINFNGNHPSQPILGDNIHYTGGFLSMYDGANVVEHGFHMYPEGLDGTSSATSGYSLGIGASAATLNQMQYCAVYEWVDNQGQTHRSAPSVPVTVQLPSVTALSFTGDTTKNSNRIDNVSSFVGLYAGQVISNTNFPSGTYITLVKSGGGLPHYISVSNNASATASGTTITTKDIGQNTITIPMLRTTAKKNVLINVYRTENNGTVFYLQSTNANDPTTDSITIDDAIPDALLSSTELYTTGEIENIAAPAISCATLFKSRILAVPYESPLSWWFSKQVIPGSPVEFNDSFVENVDSKIGAITAIGTLDEKIILFGADSKYFVVGSGPAPSGVNNDFTDAQRLAGSTGCQNQASLLEIPTGLLYQDKTKGIYLLDRSLQEQYIGYDVDKFSNKAVTSVRLVPGQTIVRLTLDDGQNLTYDYTVNQWSTDTYHSAAIDSTIYNSAFYYLTSGGLVNYETSGTYTDNGTPILMSFATGWANWAGIEGFARVYEMQLFGTYFSPHTLTINVYTNYSDTIKQTITIPVLTSITPYQFRIRFNDQVQRCESIKIEILESQASSYGQGFSLSGLNFRVGIKQGLFKLPSSASY